tara:strand:+ start:604 stop:738 length:135 start_codon:yes stop_codon:yes gene_type:complete
MADKDKWEIVYHPTQKKRLIKNKKTNKQIDIMEAIVKILNKLDN